jgi:hypothetical protein
MYPSTYILQLHYLMVLVGCFTSRSRIFHLYGDVTITGEGLQILGLCSALRAFGQDRGIFNRATPAATRGLGFSGLIRRTAPFSCLLRHTICSYPDFHGSPISRLLRHTRGCGGSILTRIHTGSWCSWVIFKHITCIRK